MKTLDFKKMELINGGCDNQASLWAIGGVTLAAAAIVVSGGTAIFAVGGIYAAIGGLGHCDGLW